jgi:hypothetical protein
MCAPFIHVIFKMDWYLQVSSGDVHDVEEGVEEDREHGTNQGFRTKDNHFGNQSDGIA